MKKRFPVAIVILSLMLSFCFGAFSSTAVALAKSKKISLNKTKQTLYVGKTVQLKLKNAVAKNVKWKSSKTNVAKVSKKGLVTAKSKGTSKITATYKKKKYTCTVTVKKAKEEAPSSVTPDYIPFIDSSFNKLNICDEFEEIVENMSKYNSMRFNDSTMRVALALSICSGDLNKLEKVMNKLKVNYFEANDDYKKTPTTDSIGVACAQINTIKGSMIIVIFRSTNYGAEWASNLTVGNGDVYGKDHEGFSQAAEKAKKFIADYISRHNVNEKVNFMFVGHSRGAAVANLVAADFTENWSDTIKDNSIENVDTTAYCFATPNVAYIDKVSEFAWKFDRDYSMDKIYNFYFDRDIVNRIPPREFKLDTYGRKIHVDYSKAYSIKYKAMQDYLKELDPDAYAKFMKCESNEEKVLGGKTRSQYVDDAVQELIKITDNRVNYTQKYQNAFIAAMMLQFGGGAKFDGQIDQEAATELLGWLMNYDIDQLTIDHYPAVEYAALSIMSLIEDSTTGNISDPHF